MKEKLWWLQHKEEMFYSLFWGERKYHEFMLRFPKNTIYLEGDPISKGLRTTKALSSISGPSSGVQKAKWISLEVCLVSWVCQCLADTTGSCWIKSHCSMSGLLCNMSQSAGKTVFLAVPRVVNVALRLSNWFPGHGFYLVRLDKINISKSSQQILWLQYKGAKVLFWVRLNWGKWIASFYGFAWSVI